MPHLYTHWGLVGGRCVRVTTPFICHFRAPLGEDLRLQYLPVDPFEGVDELQVREWFWYCCSATDDDATIALASSRSRSMHLRG